MPAYYTKIRIDYFPIRVRYRNKHVTQEDKVSIEYLKSIAVSSYDLFSFYPSDIEGYTIRVSGSRLETESEMMERIKEHEAYNKRYEDFHAKLKETKKWKTLNITSKGN